MTIIAEPHRMMQSRRSDDDHHPVRHIVGKMTMINRMGVEFDGDGKVTTAQADQDLVMRAYAHCKDPSMIAEMLKMDQAEVEQIIRSSEGEK